MKKLLSLLMALMICLGIFTLAGGVHTVKAAEDDIASGTWKGVDWRITADGELILGNGGEQTFVNNDNIRNTYGWYHGNVDYRSSIKTVRVDGIVYIKGQMPCMFEALANVVKIDLSGMRTSECTRMNELFDSYGNSKLEELDISNFDMSNVQYAWTMFNRLDKLKKVVLSEKFCFENTQSGRMVYSNLLPTPTGSSYTGKWIRDDGVYGPYTPEELKDNYTSEMAGTWVWEKKPPEAYAILQDNGELVLFRADAGLTAGAGKTVTDVSGNTYTGQLYTGIETTNFNNSSNCPWYKQRISVKSVRVADGQVIKPINCLDWFYSCSNMTSCDLKGLDTSNVTSMSEMFSGCSSLTSLDLSGFDTSNVINMEQMFYKTRMPVLNLSSFNTKSVRNMVEMFAQSPELKELDISGFDTSNTTSMHLMFGYTIGLEKIKFGENFSFKGGGTSDYAWTNLLTPKGKLYSGKWIRDDKAYGPFTGEELRDNYTSAMAGTWVWELAPVEYTISFYAGESGTGAMTPVNGSAEEDFILPANQFAAFGYTFDHWDDGNGHTYADQGTIPANTYAADQKVTLTAVFKKRDTSLNWDGNEAEFSIRGGEQAVLDNIPAGTSYQVYELTPDGWVLVQQENASGVIEALEESAAAFWNKYQPGVTTVQFSGLKNLDGRPADVGKFTFELYEGDTLVDTATTQDGGFIQFKVIEYDAAGDHVYTIREVDPNDDSIDYDTHEETVEVSVIDNGDGTLSSEVTYDDDGIVFSNATRPGTLRITKNAMNRTSQNANDEFTIEIEFRNESGMPINDNIYWYIEGDSSPSDIDGGTQE